MPFFLFIFIYDIIFQWKKTMEEIILDLVAEIFGSIFYESVVKGERESFSFDKDGNLLGGPKTDAPYDKKASL